jgi:hypothetical protein
MRPLRPGLAIALLVILLAVAPAASASSSVVNSADRLTMWVGCGALTSYTDAELDLWKSRGVDGFVCMDKQLYGFGGTNAFTGDPAVSLTAAKYELQRKLRDTQIITRARLRGIKVYLGVKLVNYWNTRTPLSEWFDDAGWSQKVLPNMGNMAAAARLLGFAGLAFDQEMYGQRDGIKTATWEWNYPGNTRTEAQVRAKAKQRGRELMTRIVGAFPGVELLAYKVEFPETWAALLRKELSGDPNAYQGRLDIDFWDGISSVEGYGAIRLVDSTFYKIAGIGKWENALRYNTNRVFSFLSRRLSNWAYAASRFHVSPFSWIDPGPRTSTFDDARPPTYVYDQLQAFRKWGTGGEFANYAYNSLRSFDYSPYTAAMVAGSTPGNVDPQPPTLSVTSSDTAAVDAATKALDGVANDNLAIRSVRWSTDQGHQGSAKHSWRIISGGPRLAYVGEHLWSIPAVPLGPGDTQVTITAEDIKGLTTSSTVTIRRSGQPAGTRALTTGDRHRIAVRRAVAKRRATARRRTARIRRRCVRRVRARARGKRPLNRAAAVRRCARRAARAR